MSAALLHHILMKRGQDDVDQPVDEPITQPVDEDPGYTHSRLLPPLKPEPVAPPPPVAAVPAPVAPPPLPATPVTTAAVAKPVPKYIPPPQPGRQTASDMAAWRAAIKAQGGQGTVASPLPPGFGPKP